MARRVHSCWIPLTATPGNASTTCLKSAPPQSSCAALNSTKRLGHHVSGAEVRPGWFFSMASRACSATTSLDKTRPRCPGQNHANCRVLPTAWCCCSSDLSHVSPTSLNLGLDQLGRRFSHLDHALGSHRSVVLAMGLLHQLSESLSSASKRGRLTCLKISPMLVATL